MAGTLFSREAIDRRLGIQDSRGPKAIMSRGNNVYRGGLPNAQSGTGNPNIGRPSTNSSANSSAPNQEQGLVTPSKNNPSITTLVGSLLGINNPKRFQGGV